MTKIRCHGCARGFEAAGTCDAAFTVDALMAIIARTGRQPIDIHCPRCPHVSGDERLLLHAASLTQAGHSHLAEKALCTALLSAQGAEFALSPLQGLGKLFADTGFVSVGADHLSWNKHRLRRWNRGARRRRRQRSIDRRMIMERHLSTGVATIVALMAATRTASGRADIPFDPVEDADFAAERAAPRDQVGDWLLRLARHRASTGEKAGRRKPG